MKITAILAPAIGTVPLPHTTPVVAPPVPKELQRKAVRGIAWSGLQNMATSGVAFITYTVLARLLPPGDFGLLAFAAVFIVFLQMFVDQGIPDAIVQRSEVRPGHLNAAFWFNLLLSAGLAASLWFGAPAIAGLFHESRLASILRWLTPMLLFSAISAINQALMKRHLEYRRLALVNLVSALAAGAVAVVCACRHGGVWSLVAQQITASAFTAGLTMFYCQWWPGLAFHLRDLRELLHFSVHVTTSAILDFFNRRSDDFLIGYFLGPVVLGYYSLAYRVLMTFTRLITTPFNSVGFSAFSRLQHQPEERRQFFYRLTRTVALIGFPVFLGLAAVAPDVVDGFFGAKWRDSAPVLRILCFIGMLHSVAFLHGTLMRAAGRAKWQMWFTFAGALTNVAGFLYFARLGILYVAGWYVLSAYLWLGADLVLLQRILQHPTRTYLRGFLQPLLSALAVAGAAFLVLSACPREWPILVRMTLEGAAGTVALFATQPQLGRSLRGRLTPFFRQS
jgi:PST family polysaccharide transporter